MIIKKGLLVASVVWPVEQYLSFLQLVSTANIKFDVTIVALRSEVQDWAIKKELMFRFPDIKVTVWLVSETLALQKTNPFDRLLQVLRFSKKLKPYVRNKEFDFIFTDNPKRCQEMLIAHFIKSNKLFVFQHGLRLKNTSSLVQDSKLWTLKMTILLHLMALWLRVWPYRHPPIVHIAGNPEKSLMLTLYSSSIKATFEENIVKTNIVYFSSGLSRYGPDRMSPELSSSALRNLKKFATLSGQQLFLKLKAGERCTDHMCSVHNVETIDSGLTFYDVFRALRPSYCICSISSTTVIEALLAGINIIVYSNETSLFSGYSDPIRMFAETYAQSCRYTESIGLFIESSSEVREQIRKEFLMDGVELNYVIGKFRRDISIPFHV